MGSVLLYVKGGGNVGYKFRITNMLNDILCCCVLPFMKFELYEVLLPYKSSLETVIGRQAFVLLAEFH